MMSVEPITLPPSVDEHKLVMRHAQQLRALQEKLDAEQSRLVALTAQRAQVQRAEQDAVVAHLLGDTAAPPDKTPLAALDSEIANVRCVEVATRESLEALRAIAAGVRAQIERELDAQKEQAAVAVLAAMVPALEQFQQLNLQLVQLRGGSALAYLPLPPSLVDAWLTQAREKGGL